MAEDLADYLTEMGVKTHYLHSEIQTMQRGEILRDMRPGVHGAEGRASLRAAWWVSRPGGRAPRHVDGRAIMYADTMTESMRRAIEETERRRRIQQEYNERHGIQPDGDEKAM